MKTSHTFTLIPFLYLVVFLIKKHIRGRMMAYAKLHEFVCSHISCLNPFILHSFPNQKTKLKSQNCVLLEVLLPFCTPSLYWDCIPSGARFHESIKSTLLLFFFNKIIKHIKQIVRQYVFIRILILLTTNTYLYTSLLHK